MACTTCLAFAQLTGGRQALYASQTARRGRSSGATGALRWALVRTLVRLLGVPIEYLLAEASTAPVITEGKDKYQYGWSTMTLRESFEFASTRCHGMGAAALELAIHLSRKGQIP
jgi:hypothetical protein